MWLSAALHDDCRIFFGFEWGSLYQNDAARFFGAHSRMYGAILTVKAQESFSLFVLIQG
jgi:hypothetical protein